MFRRFPFLLFLFPLFLKSKGEENNSVVTHCPEHRCGDVVIRYPFWKHDDAARATYCGYPGFGINCDGTSPVFHMSNHAYFVKDINYTDSTLTLVDNDVCDNPNCPRVRHNVTLGALPLSYSILDSDLIFYFNCNTSVGDGRPIECLKSNQNQNQSYYISRRVNERENSGWYDFCKEKVVARVIETELEDLERDYGAALREGFVLDWRSAAECVQCEEYDGKCVYTNTTTWELVCLCPDGFIQQHNATQVCRKGNGLNLGLKIGIGIGAAAFGATFMSIIFLMYHRRLKKRNSMLSMVSGDMCSYPTSVADLEKPGNYLGVHIFDYNELVEATNNFDSSKELGDGGYGTVYKGKLRDGRFVAIKRLYENNYKRVEQFMNEVEILTRLRHRNLVTLYGCTSYRCRELLLVYEYVSNGTVADHLHGEGAKPGLPSWSTRLNIAIETAQALAYLHVSGVIHRDVKTNNILIDSHFCVKVADFGLSRFSPANVTHISTAPQGTPGYVDPEYHQYYHLTDKSDVYSFGVVLVELISSKLAVDITRHRDEINLANMAVRKIQNNSLHELVDPYLGYESDLKVKTTITAVAELAFRCLQLRREMRPSMQEVLMALQEIQSNDYSLMKAEEIDLSFKNDTIAYSPDSETVASTHSNPNS